MRHANACPAVEVPASANVTAVLCQRRDMNPGRSEQEGGDNQNLSQNRIAKDKARHIPSLPPIALKPRGSRELVL
jgi:hypothetical protein